MNKIEIVDNEYVKIYMKHNRVGFFDIEFLDVVKQYHWCSCKDGNTYYMKAYAKIDGKRTNIKLHRLIMGSPEGKVINHKDHNGLNNRKYNLEICTHVENSRYANLSKVNTSGYKGVYWHKRGAVWCAKIKYCDKAIHLGSFKNKIDAAKAYNEAALKYHGQFALLNVIEQND